MDEYGTLFIQTLGHLDILFKGKSIIRETQSNIKVMSIFEYLVANHSYLCSPDRIMQALWPENDYMDEKKVLQTYIHRLRAILSGENSSGENFSKHITVTNVKGDYRLDLSENVILDTNELKKQAALCYQLDSAKDLVESAQTLLDLYKGHYMQNSNHEHVVLYLRNSYFQTFSRSISNILRKLCEVEAYEDILQICESIFLFEDLEENVNYYYIKSLIMTKQVSAALRHYKYLEKRMKSELNIFPSEEISKLINLTITQNSCGSEKPHSTLDEDKVVELLEKIISEKFSTDIPIRNTPNRNFFVLAELENCPPHLSSELLENTLMHNLRRDDMFTIIKPEQAIVLLHMSKENQLDLVNQRISNCLQQQFPDNCLKLNMSLLKTHCVS